LKEWDPLKISEDDDHPIQKQKTCPTYLLTCFLTEKMFPYDFPLVVCEAKLGSHTA